MGMQTMKEDYFSELRMLLYGKIPNEYIQKTIEVVSFSLKDFDLQRKETSVIVYDNGDEMILKKFFVAKAVEGLCGSSLSYYRTILSAFLKKTGKHINEITTDDIRIYLAMKKLEKLSDNSLNNIRRTLSSFFSWTTEENITSRNPTLRIKGIRQTRRLKKPLNEDEMEILRHGAKTKRDKAIIEFLFSTGCRVSEMVNINRNDIDLLNGQVDVLGKGRKYRTVYLSSRCKISLEEYLRERNDTLEALFISDYSGMKNEVFFKKDIHRISRGAVEIMLRNLGRRVGIENVHPHRFRRTAATLALKRGMPIEQVQKMLGHESINTTTIYAQSSNDEIKTSHEKYII